MSFIENPLERTKLANNNEYPLSPAYRTEITGTGANGVMDYSVNISKTASQADGSVTIGGSTILPLFKIFNEVLTNDEIGALSGNLTISGQLIDDYYDPGDPPRTITYTSESVFNYGATTVDKLASFLGFIESQGTWQNLSEYITAIPACYCICGVPFMLISTDGIYEDTPGVIELATTSTGTFITSPVIDPTSTAFAVSGTFTVADYHFDTQYTGHTYVPTIMVGTVEASLVNSAGAIPHLDDVYPNLESLFTKFAGKPIVATYSILGSSSFPEHYISSVSTYSNLTKTNDNLLRYWDFYDGVSGATLRMTYDASAHTVSFAARS